VDAKGEVCAIPTPPARIASGTLFTDAVLLACCPHERIAALHEVSKNPLFSPVAAVSRGFPRHLTPDPESFLAVHPDLVFLSSFSDKKLQQIVSAPGRAVIRLYGFEDIPGVQDNIRAVGYIIGRDAAAEELVETMQARLDLVAERRSERRAWRVLSWSDGFVAGKNTLFDDVLGYVGATNVAATAGVDGARHLRVERVLALDPDALVIGVMPGREAEARQQLQAVTGMASLDAVRRDRIVFVPNALLMSTTHHLAGAAEAIAATLDRWGKP
jgi:iron complex transport system substrate-binding protein